MNEVLSREIAALSRDERLELVDEILKSIEDGPLTDAQKAEIDRRLADGPEAIRARSRPWEEVYDELRQRYS